MSEKRFTLVITKPEIALENGIQRANLKRELESDPYFDSLLFPVFHLTPNDGAAKTLIQFVESGEHKKLIVFVSPSALELGMSVLKQWPLGVACGLMGSQSAELAQTLGVPKAAIVAPNVEFGEACESSAPLESSELTEDSNGLYKLVHRRCNSKEYNLLVCKGPRGRSWFHEQLKADGFEVEVLETYNRQPIEHNASDYHKLFELGEQAVLWLTSSESAQVFHDGFEKLAPDKIHPFKRSAQCLVSHPRIESEVRRLGFTNVTLIGTGIPSVKQWLHANTLDLSSNPKIQESKTVDQTMSESQKNMPSGQPETLSPDHTKPPAVTPSASREPSDKTTTGRPFNWVGWAALVAVLGLAFLGQSRLEQTKQVVGERLQEEKTRLTVLQEQYNNTETLYRDLKARFALLEEAQKQAEGQRAVLESVYQELVGNRAAVSLSEIEQLISIAKRQLYVLGNIKGARVALQQAVELLEKTEQPRLIALRVGIEKDLVELNAVKTVDLLALAIELDSVIDSAATIPTLAAANASTDMTLAELSHGGPGQKRVDPIAHNPNFLQATLGAVSNLIINVWEDIKSLVEITRVETPEVLQLSMKQQEDLRNTLRLSMLNARLSMLQRHTELLQSDLNRSRALVATYFDQDDAQVQRMLQVLEKLGDTRLELSLPSLKNATTSLAMAKAAEGEGN